MNGRIFRFNVNQTRLSAAPYAVSAAIQSGFFRHAARNGRLKYVAQKAALPEPTVAVLGKRRMIRDAVTKVQAAKPAIGQVQMNLFAEVAFRPDAGAITNQQHSNERFWVEGWSTSMTIEIGQICADATQINKAVNRPQKVTLRDVILQRELIKQRRLRFLLWSQLSQIVPFNTGIESAACPSNKEEFFNTIGSQPPFAAICTKVSYTIFNELGQLLT